ncbi:MAG: hypothetical protein WC745_04495 [Patescibacteria group bacterium]|jgi:actin-related protein
MGKSLDGIRKLNDSSRVPRSAEQREVDHFNRERSRRLVLKTIGEKDPENTPPARQSPDKNAQLVMKSALFGRSKRPSGFDGITKTRSRASGDGRNLPLAGDLKKEEYAGDKEKINKLLREKKEEEEKVRQEEERSEEEETRLKQEDLKREAENKRSEEVRRIKEADRKRREEEEKERSLKEREAWRMKEEEEKQKAILLKIAEEERREAEKKRREEEEKKKSELSRKLLEEKKKKDKEEKEKEKKRKKARKKIKREERKKRMKESVVKIADGIKRFGKGLKDGTFAFVKYSRLPVLGLFAVYFILYIVFSAALLVFQIDNPNMRRAGEFFPPVPALFTKEWVVGYFTYADAMKESGLAAEEMDDYFIEKIALDRLYWRYALRAPLTGGEGQKETLGRLIIKDEEINKVPIARIKKIHELISEEGFYSGAAKYADKSGTAQLADLGLQSDGFSGITKPEEISPVIYAKDGYYILKFSGIDEKKSDQVDYVFVKAKTLDEYLAEKKAGLRVFKLARD